MELEPGPRVDAGLDSPHLSAHHPARRILASALKRRGALGGRHAAAKPWGAEHFGLELCSAFLALGAQARRDVLAECGRGLLEEAYFIEKLGLAFAAKMALSAESTEERAAHCLFAADEAVHLAQVSSFFPDPPARTADPFLRWLAGIIEEMPPQSARLLIQVLLEGWGITHYRALSRSCLVPALQETLSKIARDEALHHSAGVALFDASRVQGLARRKTAERIHELFDMVRAGPARVVSAVERAHGGLSDASKAALNVELRSTEQAQTRLALLRKLLDSAGASFLAA